MYAYLGFLNIKSGIIKTSSMEGSGGHWQE